MHYGSQTAHMLMRLLPAPQAPAGRLHEDKAPELVVAKVAKTHLSQHRQWVACVHVEVVQQRRHLLVALRNLHTRTDITNGKANKLTADNATTAATTCFAQAHNFTCMCTSTFGSFYRQSHAFAETQQT